MMAEQKLEIREIEPKDITSMVSIHLRSFEGFFLTFMGRRFLHVLYRAICNDPTGIGFLIRINDEIAGFVIGTSQISGLYSRLIKSHFFEFCFASIYPIIRKPTALFHLLRTFTFTKQQEPSEDSATLMSIAISPEFQGNNLGKILVEKFLDEASNRGCKKTNLNTDAENNDKTNKFYQKLGFSIHQTFTTHEGRKMNEYRINL